HTVTTASASNHPPWLATVDQSAVDARAARPESSAQLTGLTAAAVLIQPGLRSRAMNADERNVNGSSRKMLSPMMVSRWRTSRPIVLESAANTTPTTIDATTSTTSPSTPPG